MALSEFGRAFAEARKRGDKVFSFKGKRYTTELKQDTPSAPMPKPDPDPPESGPMAKPRPSLGEAMKNVKYGKDGASRLVDAMKANTSKDPAANAEATAPARDQMERDRKKFRTMFIGK